MNPKSKLVKINFETLTRAGRQIYKFATFQEELERLGAEKEKKMRLETQIINFKAQINPNAKNSKH